MDDLMQKLQTLLNDPDVMRQAKEIADSMSQSQPSAPAQQTSGGTGNDTDLSALAGMLFGKSGGTPGQGGVAAQTASVPQPSGTPDISKLLKLQSIMERAGASNKNIDLITALRPHLRPENQQKADRLIKIFRIMSLYPLLKESGLFGGDLLGIL